MPIYDYKCDGCGKEFDLTHSVTEYKSEEPCPDCGGVGKRVLKSAPAVQLKCGGFYTTENTGRAQWQGGDGLRRNRIPRKRGLK